MDEVPKLPLHRISQALWVVGLACLGWAGWSLVERAAVDAREGARLERARSSLPRGAAERNLLAADEALAHRSGAAAWDEMAEDDLVGRIVIERLGISAIVLSGAGSGTLGRAVGHIPGTALPGEGGNVGLAGHRDSFFHGLRDVEEGDLIVLETPHGDERYRVDTVFVVDPADVHVLEAPPDGERVTLVTCYPFSYVGTAPRRYIVQGWHVDSAPATEAAGRN